MTRVLALYLTLLLVSCAGSRSTTQEQAPELSRDRLFQALVAGGALDPDRQLVHMSHTCSLRVDNQSLPVIDVQELVMGASAPRGVNHIVVLDPALNVARAIEYTTERPLFCLEDRLYVWGDLAVDNVMPEGNVLRFSDGGRNVIVSQLDPNELPSPVSRDRKAPPQ